MLHFGVEVPQVVADAESPDHILVIASRERIVLAEVLIRDRPALAVVAEVAQIAIRGVIPVAIPPRRVT